MHTYAATGVQPVEVWLTGPGNILAVADTTIDVATDVTRQVGVRSSAFTLNRTTGLYDGTVTVTNNGTSAIPAVLDVLFQGLTPGVRLANATLTVNGKTYKLPLAHTGAGDRYAQIPASLLSSLAAGASVTIGVSFADPLGAAITFTPFVFSDPQLT
jgi:hypothetical protein